MSSFQRADPAVAEMGQDLISRFHPDLLTVGIHIDYLFAYAKDDEPPLVLNGYPALAIAKIIALPERALGLGDGRITIDYEHWKSAGEDQRAALLDHELYHFAVKRDKYHAFEYDDLHRPKLYMRKHDRQIGWFDVIAARHGEASIEVSQAEALMDSSGQLYWPGLDIGGPGNLDLDLVKTGKRNDDPVMARNWNPVQDFVANIRRSVGKGVSVTISTGSTSATIHGDD